MKRLIPLITGLFVLGQLAAQPTFIASQETVFDQTTVCVDVTTQDFTDLLMVEYTLNWDSDLLTYSHVENLDLEDLEFSDFDESFVNEGLLGLSWGDTLDQIGVTIPDDTRLFSICYTVESACESSPIQFTGGLKPIFVGRTNTDNNNIGAFLEEGSVATTCPDCFALAIPSLNVEASSSFCVGVETHNFNNISSFQFSLNFNPDVLSFINIGGWNGELGLSINDFDTSQDDALTVVWDDLAQSGIGLSLPDGSILFEVCFDASSNLDVASDISFSSNPLPIEINYPNGTSANFNGIDGHIAIEPEASAILSAEIICIEDVDCETNDPGFVEILIASGTPPYAFNWTSNNGFQSTEENPQLSTGEYLVEIQDVSGQSISLGPIYMGICPEEEDCLLLAASQEYGLPGDTVCVDVSVANFEGVNAATFSMNYDPDILEFVNLNITGISPNLGASNFGIPPLWPVGQIGVSWASVPDPITIPDNSIIFQVCFEVIGELNQSSPFIFTSTPFSIKFEREPEENLNYEVFPGGVHVGTPQDNLQASLECIQQPNCHDGAAGSATILVTGGESPYSYLWQGPQGFTSTEENPPLYEEGEYYVEITDQNFQTVYRDTITISCLLYTLEDITVECTDTIPTIPMEDFTTECPEGIQNITFEDETFSGNCLGEYIIERTWTITDNCGNEVSGPQIITIEDTSPPIIIGLPNDTIIYAYLGESIPEPSEFMAIDNCDENPVVEMALNLEFEFNNCGFEFLREYQAMDACGNLGKDTMMIYYIEQEPNLIDTITASPDTIVCAGESIQLTASTFGDNLVFTWSPSTGLSCTDCPNPIAVPSENTIYTLVASSGIGCMDTAEIFLQVEEPAEVVELTVAEVACFGSTDGTVEITVAGGGGPPYELYSPFPIVSNSGTFTITNLASGIYTIDFAGANGCVNYYTFEILEPNELLISDVQIIPESCPGNNDGSITIAVTGGTGFYEYLWSNNSTGPDCPGLTAGDYSVTVTDQNGCEVVGGPYTVGNGLIIDHTPNSTICIDEVLQLNVNAPNATSFEWFINGGLGNLSCMDCPNPILSDAENDVSILLTVHGPNNCTDWAEIDIDVRTRMEVGLGAPFPTPAFCEGSTAQIMGPDLPNLSYLWYSPGGEIISTESTLIIPNVTLNDSGDYTLVITDEYGCEFVETYFLEVADRPEVISTIIHESCAGLCDGSIDIESPDDPGTFSYQWSNGSNAPDLANLCPGTYSLTVASEDGCATILDFVVESQLIQNITSDTIVCVGEEVPLFVDAPGAISFEWTPVGDLSCTDCPNPTLFNVFGDIELTVTVTSETCTEERTIIVNVRNYLDFHLLPFSNSPICEGGTLELYSNVDNAQSYIWNGPNGFTSNVSNPIVPNMDASQSGIYTVEIIDDIGCFISAQADVIITSELEVTATVTNASCGGLCDGAIELIISGGTPPYLINGMPGPSTLVDLCPGDYVFSIEDANGCSTSFNVIIEGENPIVPIFEIETPVCGIGSGILNIPDASGGGGGPYTVSISGIVLGQIPLSNINLNPGTYEIEIASSAGCFEYFTIEIPQVFPMESIDVITSPSDCESGTGIVTVLVEGGTPPFIYNWSNGEQTSINTISNLQAGNYSVSVVDDNDCELIIDFEIEEGLILQISEDAVVCSGESALLSVDAPFATEISWSPATSLDDSSIFNPTAAPSETTTYIATVSNSTCSFTDSVTVFVAPVNCTEVFTDSIILNQEVTWCSILSAVGGPLGYNFTNFSCTPSSPFVDYDIDFNNLCISYTGDAIGVDTLCVEICLQTGSPCYTAELQISVIENVVYPGDSDTTGIANNHDLLMIGLAIDSIGFVRPGATINWEAQESPSWPQYTPTTGVNYKHIDTDGNGIIDLNDTLALSQNWGLEHNFWEEDEDPVNLFPIQNGVPFYIQPDTLQEGGTYALPLMLGNEEIPAEEVYGVAFSILYDPEIIKSGARFRLSDSWFGESNDLIIMQKEYHDIGRLEVGITRLDGMNTSGWGDIGDFIISIEDDILLIVPSDDIENLDTRFEIVDTKIISFEEVALPVDTTPIDAEVISSTYNPMINHLIDLFPNPATEQIFIRSQGPQMETIELYTIEGQMVYQKEATSNTEKIALKDLASGLYLVKIKTGKGIAIKKATLISGN